MRTQIEYWTAWILVRIQIVTANLDPEVLQWPGGSVIALLLWLYVVARPFWSVGAGATAARRGMSRSISPHASGICDKRHPVSDHLSMDLGRRAKCLNARGSLKVHAPFCRCRRVAPAETHGGRPESNFIAVFERDRHFCGRLVDESAVGTFKIFDTRGVA
jgi:hypothetical protein